MVHTWLRIQTHRVLGGLFSCTDRDIKRLIPQGPCTRSQPTHKDREIEVPWRSLPLNLDLELSCNVTSVLLRYFLLQALSTAAAAILCSSSVGVFATSFSRADSCAPC